MEPTPFLRPTALQHMRGFLAESGTDLPPWSSSDEVMDELVSLLHLHRGDDAFFARLVPFLEELRDHASRGVAGLTARDAEVLSRATVESLVDELRTRLRGSARSASTSIVCSVLGERASRLLCLALLSSGLAACTQRPGDSAPTAAEPGNLTPPATEVAPAEPPAPPPAPIPAAAVAAPAGADASAASADALVEMFKTKSPQEAAQELERALDAGSPEVPRPIRENHARYKGVSLR